MVIELRSSHSGQANRLLVNVLHPTDENGAPSLETDFDWGLYLDIVIVYPVCVVPVDST